MDKLIDNKLGLIAGNGVLPVKVAKKARQGGLEVYSVCFDVHNFPELKLNSEKAVHLGPGELEKIGAFLSENSIKQAMFIGKVPKDIIFRRPKLDKTAIKLLKQKRDMNDDSIMLTFVGLLENIGITVIEQTIFIRDFFVEKGIIAGKDLTPEKEADIKFGFELAKTLGQLDIGQTVVIQNKMVLALEAIEGTDQAIKRGCRLGNGDATVVKVSKPSQDQRFDIPVVGLKTLKVMKKYGAKTLAIEANETLVVDEDAFKTYANKYDITVVAV